MTPNLFPLKDADKPLKINTVWLLARCTDPGTYSVLLNPPLLHRLTRIGHNDIGENQPVRWAALCSEGRFRHLSSANGSAAAMGAEDDPTRRRESAEGSGQKREGSGGSDADGPIQMGTVSTSPLSAGAGTNP